jgi:hypothetical protein
LSSAVLNIGKVRTSKVRVSHYSDPFPADGLAGYGQNLNIYEDLKNWRQEVLGWPSHHIRNSTLEDLNSDQFYKDYPSVKDDREAFICHMLRRQLGDEKYFRLVKTYFDLRQKTGQAVPTSRFQKLAEEIYGEPLGWFFSQWVNSTALPRLKLEKVAFRKDNDGWWVRGRLVQSGDIIFRLPVELAIDTQNGREREKLLIEKKATDFSFHTANIPRKLIVDPDYEILKIQKMAPRLWWHYGLDPEYLVIYGTLGEAQANESIADEFVTEVLGYGREMIKADTDVNDADLTTKCVFLIGRPETNKVAQKFKDAFPIRFDDGKFAWQGEIYDKSTQGVAQIVVNPNDAQGFMIMFAGLSSEATRKFYDLDLCDSDGGYVIYDGNKRLAFGDWEDTDDNLYWEFGSQTSAVSSSSH